MTVTEAIQDVLGTGEKASEFPFNVNSLFGYANSPKVLGNSFQIYLLTHLQTAPAATREEMSAAQLPLQYRDSCANLLIPLNRCRYEQYYLPWKCEV